MSGNRSSEISFRTCTDDADGAYAFTIEFDGETHRTFADFVAHLRNYVLWNVIENEHGYMMQFDEYTSAAFYKSHKQKGAP